MLLCIITTFWGSEFGCFEGGEGVGIRNFFPPEGLEFGQSAFANRFDQSLVPMIDEIMKRSMFSVFFTHEEKRDGRRKKYGSGQNLLCRMGYKGGESISLRAIAYLIMILGKYDKLGR